MNQVLLLTDGLFHPPLFARRALHQALASIGTFSFQHCRSFAHLPADLDIFAAMVIYIHHKTISTHALEQLDAFVTRGGGLLAIHSATASFKQEPHYFEILGGRFSGHGPVQPFTVTPVEKNCLFQTITAFSVVDEIYIHECQPDIAVQFTTIFNEEDIPMVWTHHHGSGRVCYAAPGHRTQTLRNPAYQHLLQAALAWVTTS